MKVLIIDDSPDVRTLGARVETWTHGPLQS